MDLNYTVEDESFRQEVRQWLTENLPQTKPNTLDEKRAWHRKLYQQGYLGMGWPKRYGGREARPMEQAIVGEELARVNAPSSLNGLGIGIVAPTLIHHGTEQQKRDHVENILTAEEIWCQLYSEPNAGSDLASLQCRGDVAGDEFIINGQKIWTSGALHADWGILLARTDPDVPKHQGITYFLVDMRSPGIDIRPLRQITGSAHFNEVFLTDVRIPKENVVGEVNRGWGVTMTTLVSERTLIGSGASNPVHDLLRLADRFGGRDDANVRQQLAATYIRMRLLQFTGWRVQTAISRGEAAGPESSVLKLAHTRQLTAIADISLGIAGASGMLSDPADMEVYSWVQGFLSQWASKLGGGTDEVQRNIVSERVLGLPGDIRVDKNVPFRSLPR